MARSLTRFFGLVVGILLLVGTVTHFVTRSSRTVSYPWPEQGPFEPQA